MKKLIVFAATALLLLGCGPPEDSMPAAPASEPEESTAASPMISTTDKHVVIAADPWCPHNCEAGSDQEGYMVDIAREAFAMAGYTLEYQNVSWARALRMARQGQIHGVVGAFKTDAPDFVFPNIPQGRATIALFTHPQSSWTYQGLSSLENQTLLALNGYSYTKELDEYIEANRGDRSKVWIMSGGEPLERAIELLERKRTDVFAEDDYVMAWDARNNPNTIQLRRAGEISDTHSYVAFSPSLDNADKLAELLTQGTRMLRESGRLDAILANYGLTESIEMP